MPLNDVTYMKYSKLIKFDVINVNQYLKYLGYYCIRFTV